MVVPDASTQAQKGRWTPCGGAARAANLARLAQLEPKTSREPARLVEHPFTICIRLSSLTSWAVAYAIMAQCFYLQPPTCCYFFLSRSLFQGSSLPVLFG